MSDKRAARIEACRRIIADTAATEGEKDAARAAIARLGGTVNEPTPRPRTSGRVFDQRDPETWSVHNEPGFRFHTTASGWGDASDALRDLFRSEDVAAESVRRYTQASTQARFDAEAQRVRDEADAKRAERTRTQAELREDASRLRDIAAALETEADALVHRYPDYASVWDTLASRGHARDEVPHMMREVRDRILDMCDWMSVEDNDAVW